MPLQIDPRLPLVWRSPDSLQFGVDEPAVVLETVSNAEERIISALMRGVTRGGLAIVADRAGVGAAAADALLARLSPALRGRRPLRTLPRAAGVVTIGDSLTALHVRSALVTARLTPAIVGAAAASTAEASARIAVLVGHFVIDPADHGRWLRRDVPHLPVVLGDAGAQLGPFVEPGSGPCLHCLQLHRTDADPAWPAIASQLWGRTSPIESPVLATEIAAAVARLVAMRLADGPARRPVSLTIDAESGERVRREWAPHPECGCASPRGTGSAGGRLLAAAATAPTTGATAAAPA